MCTGEGPTGRRLEEQPHDIGEGGNQHVEPKCTVRGDGRDRFGGCAPSGRGFDAVRPRGYPGAPDLLRQRCPPGGAWPARAAISIEGWARQTFGKELADFLKPLPWYAYDDLPDDPGRATELPDEDLVGGWLGSDDDAEAA